VELAGERVLLRPWRAGEGAWFVHARDEQTFMWTSEHRDLTPEDAELAIAAAAHPYSFALVERATGQLAGNFPVLVNGDVAVIGYWLAPAARGRGLVRDALATVLRWLPSIGVTRAELEIKDGNVASIRAAESAGFTHEGERVGMLLYARALGQ
jgi:RimJ/RimL family protein N-acetyltransferase